MQKLETALDEDQLYMAKWIRPEKKKGNMMLRTKAPPTLYPEVTKDNAKEKIETVDDSNI